MRNLVGTPARGDDFYGRDPFVRLVWKWIGRGHVVLAAPRRFGKTSVMYRLIDQPRDGYQIVHLDLEAVASPADFLTELLVKMSRDTALGKLLEGAGHVASDLWRGLRGALDEVEIFDMKLKLRDQIRPEWPEVGRQVFARVGRGGPPLLFLLDEFPMLIDRLARLEGRPDEARALLTWLRALRQSPECANIRFLVAGSIGIDAVLAHLGEAKSMNDFQRLTLAPFAPEVADSFLETLASAENLTLPPDSRRAMRDLSGIGVPFFLQILFAETSKHHDLTGESITPEVVRRLYHDKVLGVECKPFFDHYYGRLRETYRPQEERAVKRLLREVARSRDGLSRTVCLEIFRGASDPDPGEEEALLTLTHLENDFYLSFDLESARYVFSSSLLRDWWLRHYGLEAG